eukprot:11892854-Heterocapsa_arctica.AAC.1
MSKQGSGTSTSSPGPGTTPRSGRQNTTKTGGSSARPKPPGMLGSTSYTPKSASSSSSEATTLIFQ